MLRINITDYCGNNREESLKDFLDSRYVVLYDSQGDHKTIFCKSKDELFDTLGKDHDNVDMILELYGATIEDDLICFLTKDFSENN